MTKSIRDVLSQFIHTHEGDTPEEQQEANDLLDRVEAALREREQEALTDLVTVGSRFGVMPQIAAKVFADNDLGEARSEEEKELITQGFNVILDQFAEASGIPREALAFPPTTVEHVEVPDTPDGTAGV